MADESDDKKEYADYWAQAVKLFTGYEAPPRSSLFDEITGNHGIKQMKVEVTKQDSVESVTGHEYDWMVENAGWDIQNTDFVIPFYTAGGYEGVTYYKARFTLLGVKIVGGKPVGGEVVGREGKSNYSKELEDGHFKPSKDGTVWNTLPLTQYSYGTGRALHDLLEEKNGTLGFSWGGKGVELGQGVRLQSFDMVAASFDRVARFFWNSKNTMDEWLARVGTEQNDAWLGQAAGVFWDLVHQLRRRYDNYAEDMGAVGESPSKQGEALRNAGAALKREAEFLRDKWDYWSLYEGNPLRWLVDLLAEIADHSWYHNLTQVDADYTPGSYTAAGSTAGHWDYTPTAGFTSQATDAHSRTYGDMSSLDTWKNVGDAAIERWETSVQEKLVIPAQAALRNLATAWGTSTFDLGSINTKGDKGLKESFTEDKTEKEKQDAEAKAAKDKADLDAKYEKDKQDAEAKAAKDKADSDAKYEKDKADAKAEAAKDKADSDAKYEKDKADAKAEAAKEKADAKAEAAKDKAETEAKQEEIDRKREEKEKEAEARTEAKEKEAEAKQAEADRKREEKEKEVEARTEAREKEQEEIRKAQEAKQDQIRAEQDKKQEETQQKQDAAQRQAQAFQVQQANQQRTEQNRREKEQDKKQAEAEAKQEEIRRQQEAKQAEAEQKREEKEKEAGARQAEQEKKQEEIRKAQEAKQDRIRTEQEARQEEAGKKQEELRAEQEKKQEEKEKEAEARQAQAEAKQDEIRQKQEARQEEIRAEQEKKQEAAQRKQEEYQHKQQQLSRQLNGGDLSHDDTGDLGRDFTSDISGPVNGDDSLTNPDGSTSHLDSHGRVVTEHPDGSRTVVDPHTQMATITRPDGSTYSGPLNAGDSLPVPGGGTTHLDPQGQVVTEYPDGSISRVDPDTGATSITSPDGTTTTGYLNDPGSAAPGHPGSQLNGGHSGPLNTPSYDYGDPSYEEELYDDSPYREPTLGGAAGGTDGAASRGTPLNSGPMPGMGAGGAGMGGMPMGGMPMGGMGGMGGAGGKGNDGPSERVRNVIDTGEVVSNRRPGAAPRGKGVYEERQAVTTSGASPFLPPMAGGAGGSGQTETESSEREREVWEPEDDDVWGTDEGGAPAVIGR
ncbi:microtubule/TRAF3 and DISC1 binding protein [Streptomyces albus subsp. chlorinus]|uniref:AAWKG family protein n=1 Tax=Streptomyces albus TaxID=1888 RepID=UPI00156DF9B8|nr:AAWKG family protein [Streptomyces albus]NSC24350.1 microtubule/TRAF3 and DISC1 binding protein [Streptomyces albus subsp. chlorinus]